MNPEARDKPCGRAADYVEVVYALLDTQTIVRVPFEAGMTAADAMERSGICNRHPEIRSLSLVFGVHGVRVEATTRLSARNRLEICRPLVADPRQMRFDLVSKGQVMGRGKTR